MIQREKFIGDQAKHHLHIEIHQDHYKFGVDKGSRIELGSNGNYRLDQLIFCRNYLESVNGSGRDACFEWLERECRAHPDWDEGVGFVPSWEREVVEENKHVDAILDFGAERRFERGDFEGALDRAKSETEREVLGRIDMYPNAGSDDEEKEQAIREEIGAIELRPLLASWSGFDQEKFALEYDKSVLAEYFRIWVRDYLLDLLLGQFGPRKAAIETYGGSKVEA